MTFDEIKNKLALCKVGIAGAGGLGSNCAVALVRAGLGKLIIADFDVVNLSNLNRQYYFSDQVGMKKVEALTVNLLRINLHLELQAIDKKLYAEDIATYFIDCDVIVEAFDDKEQKQMLIETVIEYLPKTPLVIGTGMAGWGDNNSIKTEQYDNIYVCGDQVAEVDDNLPPLGPRVGVVSNMQANQVLEILLGKMPTKSVN
ncbi:MAG: sulfur carrier protein ThiS adenylyltransferase ThiF [Salinivirgaceae bacterium]|nr:sulfur carrier protein ThiS adenylyltransferase ThiF [Salinivirgaceae bacterium]